MQAMASSTATAPRMAINAGLTAAREIVLQRGGDETVPRSAQAGRGSSAIGARAIVIELAVWPAPARRPGEPPDHPQVAPPFAAVRAAAPGRIHSADQNSADGLSTFSNVGGMTPMTVTGVPLMLICRPTTPGSAPNWRRQRASLMMYDERRTRAVVGSPASLAREPSARRGRGNSRR